jgi:hypothetical protein
MNNYGERFQQPAHSASLERDALRDYSPGGGIGKRGLKSLVNLTT